MDNPFSWRFLQVVNRRHLFESVAKARGRVGLTGAGRLFRKGNAKVPFSDKDRGGIAEYLQLFSSGGVTSPSLRRVEQDGVQLGRKETLPNAVIPGVIADVDAKDGSGGVHWARSDDVLVP